MTPVEKQCRSTIHLTPPHVLEAIRGYFGGAIPLDPATQPDNPTGASRFFTEADNGLKREWSAGVFVNPPYGKQFPAWIRKIAEEAARGVEILALLPGSKRTETEYWPVLYGERLKAVCFVRGRLSFLTAEGEVQKGNTQDSALYGLNIDVARFGTAFSTLGGCFELA
ncbi:MAG: DNA N-6-adenine-methyltransferase [Planctomycetota bacterium]